MPAAEPVVHIHSGARSVVQSVVPEDDALRHRDEQRARLRATRRLLY
jgi:hypothetical protein